MLRLKPKRWRIAPLAADAAALAAEAGCSPLAAQLLLNRGIRTATEARRFLHPSLSDLPDPMLLPDAEKASERLRQALANREKIAIHGDYDGDGVTSAALWMRLLQRLGADVTAHVPHRRRDGYDMRSGFVAQAKIHGVRLILTTDCGIQRCEEVEEAREAGIDVIVTDHHEPGERLPNGAAVVNPHRKDSRYPFPWLAGVGVAFRLGEALVRHLGMPVDSYRRAFVDLAALGTVTDMMPLHGDNRVIVKFGLEELRTTRKVGLQALMAAAAIPERALTTRDIGFILGPRLNAAGRLDDSDLSLQLLLTRDASTAAAISARLEQVNSERRQEQERVLAEAVAQAAALDLSSTSCLVLSGATWHSGVIGLVAGNLVERFNRPAILIAADEKSGIGRGSARSIGPFNIFDAMTSCGDHLLEFGGHSHAAGMSLALTSVDSFARAINEIASAQLTEEDFQPALDVDLEVDLQDVTLPLARELALLEPWGCGNDEPVLLSRGLTIVDARRMGKEQQHLKLWVRGPHSPAAEAVIWGAGDLADQLRPGLCVGLCYRAGLNTFNGRTSVQLFVDDVRPAEMDD